MASGYCACRTEPRWRTFWAVWDGLSRSGRADAPASAQFCRAWYAYRMELFPTPIAAWIAEWLGRDNVAYLAHVRSPAEGSDNG